LLEQTLADTLLHRKDTELLRGTREDGETTSDEIPSTETLEVDVIDMKQHHFTG